MRISAIGPDAIREFHVCNVDDGRDHRAVTTSAYELDPRTGRPLKQMKSLSDEELEREITIAALSTRRLRRYEELLAERRRRSASG